VVGGSGTKKPYGKQDVTRKGKWNKAALQSCRLASNKGKKKRGGNLTFKSVQAKKKLPIMRGGVALKCKTRHRQNNSPRNELTRSVKEQRRKLDTIGGEEIFTNQKNTRKRGSSIYEKRGGWPGGRRGTVSQESGRR